MAALPLSSSEPPVPSLTSRSSQARRASQLVCVVVAYGTPQLLCGCLRAIDSAFPVMVVDNSSDPDVERVSTHFGAAYLDPGHNLGFGAGVNYALSRLDLTETNVLLINPDARIDPDSAIALEECLTSNPSLACVAPFLLTSQNDLEQGEPWAFPTPLRAWLDALGLGSWRASRDYVCGAVVLLSGRALLEIGGFDERFFLYAEETDWQRRAAAAGWRVKTCAGAVASHLGEATDRNRKRSWLRRHAGTQRYILKHHGVLGWQVYRAARVAGALARAASPGRDRRAALDLALTFATGPEKIALKKADLPPARPLVPFFSSVGKT